MMLPQNPESPKANNPECEQRMRSGGRRLSLRCRRWGLTPSAGGDDGRGLSGPPSPRLQLPPRPTWLWPASACSRAMVAGGFSGRQPGWPAWRSQGTELAERRGAEGRGRDRQQPPTLFRGAVFITLAREPAGTPRPASPFCPFESPAPICRVLEAAEPEAAGGG